MKVPPAAGRRTRRRSVAAIGFLVVLLILLGGWANFYTELLWFRETGYQDVFLTGLWVRFGLGAVFGLIFAAVLLLNVWIARRITSPARLFTVSDQILERYRAVMGPAMRWIVVGGALLFGLFAGSGASVKWREWLLFRNTVDFGQVDPVYGKDIGFYVFRLPFHQFLYTWAFSSLIVIVLIVAFVHYFLGGIRPQARGDRVAPEVRAHLSVLLGVVVLLKAWGYRLDQFGLLYSDRGLVTGASYTDVNAERPALTLLIVIAIVCAVLFFVNAKFKNWILPVGGIGLLVLTSVLAGGIYPAAIQRLRVTPNERLRELPFIERNIEATRQAYGIGGVETRPFSGTATLTSDAVERNRDTVANIRLWDPDVLSDAYLQLQRVKQYYEFLDVDVDRYDLRGGRRQVMLSAREIHPRDLDQAAQTWINLHLVYTHGYGLVASRVNRVTTEGQPDFAIRNIPPESEEGAPQITQPRVYFGESEETPFVIVNSEQDELDFPVGEGFETTNYEGNGGIELKGPLRRAAFAWRFRDFNILISGALRSDSRILFRRQILERVEEVVPFMKLDPDPYIAVIDGRLTWIVDAYTTTEMFPYSQRVGLPAATGGQLGGRANYIRNSVKFAVDTLDGTVIGYLWDETDPIIRAWSRAFPGIFRPRSEMPPSLLEHVRYPEALFRVQSSQFGTYHITDPDNFYSKEDAWLVANDPDASALAAPGVQPYYILMRLPGEEELSFVLVRPFTPQQRQNLSAYMVAHNDPENYGEMAAYLFTKTEAILGPEQVRARINQDPVVSQLITLLGSVGSEILYGNLLIVPIEESLLYVQPLYVKGQGARFPELKRVVVVTKDKVQIAPTLEGAIAALFGEEVETGEEEIPGAPADLVTLIQRALEHFEASQAALREGDFATYGREQDLMRRALEQAAEQAGAAPSPSPSPTP